MQVTRYKVWTKTHTQVPRAELEAPFVGLPDTETLLKDQFECSVGLFVLKFGESLCLA